MSVAIDWKKLLPADWWAVLKDEFAQAGDLKAFLEAEMAGGEAIFPLQTQWFRALHESPLAETRVVILGQDPYPTAGHAHGLSFSVDSSLQKLPKSLQNIYRELADDLDVINVNGDLSGWAQQGVLLLNTVLTVREGAANSHQKQGWESITDAIIAEVNDSADSKVFVLWGAHAQKKGRNIDREKHCVIETAHPSPLSAYRGFLGSQPFSQINAYLKQQGKAPIDWRIASHGFDF